MPETCRSKPKTPRRRWRRKKVKFIKIDGETPPQKRQGLVDAFQLQPEMRVAVLSIRAAGVGLTLTVRPAASHLRVCDLGLIC